MPPPSAKGREASSASRSRVASVSLAARLPASERAASVCVRTQNASVFNASANPPPSGAGTSVPRPPIAPSVIVRSVVWRSVPVSVFSVSTSSPAP